MPDTMNYMLVGYALAFVVMLLIVASIWWRYRSLQADEAALHQLEAETRSERSAPTLERHDPAQVR